MKRVMILSSVFLFLLFCADVKGQVLINEFSSGSTSDWIELYNISTESADLSAYKLTDSGSNDKTLSGTISANGFISFSFSNWLNNSDPDGVKLFKGSDLIDSIFYGDDGQVCFAGPGESIGRYPDGGNTIRRFFTSTRDSSNNSAALYPCPSPTPVHTSTPTSAPIPSPSHTPTTTPINTPTPSPVKTYTPKPTPKSTPQILGEEINQTPGVDILGLRNSLGSPDPASGSAISEKRSFPVMGGILIGLGTIMISLAFYLAFKKQKEGSSGTISE